MLKKTFPTMVLFAIVLASLIGAVNAEQGMLTYTNEEYGFSIDYPEDWTVEEDTLGLTVVFWGPMKDGFVTNVNVLTEKLSMKITPEEYAKSGELYPEESIVRTFTDTINGNPVAGYVVTSTPEEGIEYNTMQACFVSGTTAYVISFNAPVSTYDETERDYFDPVLQSFKFIEKEAGIRIQSFIVKPSRVETGEEVKVKFEAVNEADVEKTRTFHLVDLLPVITSAEVEREEIDFRTVTLASGEREIVEFTFIPKEAGEHTLMLGDQSRILEVTEAAPEEGKGVLGFETAFAIIGLLAVAYLLRRRR